MPEKDYYAKAGVDTTQAETALKGMLRHLNPTFALRKGLDGQVALESGYYANIIKLGDNQGLALTTDGVGTKVIVAEMLHKYDTIGIDCVAMNVNDLLCVGAEPISMLDYLAVQVAHGEMLAEIGKGLAEGARQANIAIPGGELAQLPELLVGQRKNYGFDLVGMAIGTVPLDRIIIGQDIRDGDVLVGLASSGIHSNGLTMARRVLFDQTRFAVNQKLDDLGGKTVGEELLTPTYIYVKFINDLLRMKLNIKAMYHITGDGFLNLTRSQRPVGYFIDSLPDTPPIFQIIQQQGRVPDSQMYQIFNMGIGFCLTLPHLEALQVISLAEEYGFKAHKLGVAVEDEQRKIIIEPKNLVGIDGVFRSLL